MNNLSMSGRRVPPTQSYPKHPTAVRRKSSRPLMPVGTRVGWWEVIETGLHIAYGNESRRAVRVRCLACGETEALRSCFHLNRSLKRGGGDQTCGCKFSEKMKAIEEAKNPPMPVGTRIGIRTIIENGLYIIFDSQTQRACRVRCDCGTVAIVTCSDLRSGKSPSCGCKSRDRDIETVWNDLLAKHSRRGWDCHLTLPQLKLITQLPCSYCGKEPSNVHRLKYKVGGVYQRGVDISMEIRWSGLDRIDSKLGYLPGNVVPCCFECNRMKTHFPLDTFLAFVERIRSHNPTAVGVRQLAATMFDEAS